MRLPAPKMSIKDALKIAKKVSGLSPAEMSVREIMIGGALLVLANRELDKRTKEIEE